MKLKISGTTDQQLQIHIRQVMNIACVVAGQGAIPDDYDTGNPHSGKYWTFDAATKKYDLLPISNNHWAFVWDSGEYWQTIEFSYRYDRPEILLSDALTRLMGARFADFCEIVE